MNEIDDLLGTNSKDNNYNKQNSKNNVFDILKVVQKIRKF